MSKAVIIESSVYWATYLAQCLETENIQVEQVFRKGSGWFNFLARKKFDYVFVDDQLQDRAGLEILHMLSEMGHSQGIVVFTHSLEGADGNAIERSAITLGADYCLQKPFRTKTLARIIRNSREEE